MDKTLRIGLACAIGGALTLLTTFLVAPNLWWLGLFSGIAGGYVAYEFRDWIAAMPGAAHKTRRSFGERGAQFIDTSVAEVVGWYRYLVKKRPMLHLTLLFLAPALLWYGLAAGQGIAHEMHAEAIAILQKGHRIDVTGFRVATAVLAFLALLPALAAIGVGYIAIGVFAMIGARWCDQVIVKAFGEGQIFQLRNEVALIVGDPLPHRTEYITYDNTLVWFSQGIIASAIFLGFYLWVYLARFVYFLFKSVHSDERVLCALDGTLGGAVIWWAFVRGHVLTVGEASIILAAGAVAGAMVGVLSWELISKRLLKVQRARS